MHKLGYVLLQLEPTPPDIPLVFELGVGFPPKLGFHVFWEMMEEYRSKVGQNWQGGLGGERLQGWGGIV